MNNISTRFTIKDLENLSGIKAHTIRIWEKRYGILVPSRTDTNIRFYDSKGLKKLLNVSLLYKSGYKISKIAKLSEDELRTLVKESMAKGNGDAAYFDALVLSMLTFNQALFEHTYNRLVADYSFRHVFVEVLVPLLHNIGIHWQSESITPANEHFISNLIQQKLHVNIERVQHIMPDNHDEVYVLYLPENEIHELGLLYLHYELMLKGYHSIYLGQSVPMDNLITLQSSFNRITYVSYFTIRPEQGEVESYLEQFGEKVLVRNEDCFWVTGRNVRHSDIEVESNQLILFNDLNEILNKIV
ncbi:MAG: MerR family transcriptional regulator [Bacteroidia bacterium]|nr:MerR family transcriptional regulator [Bacteroidia bacterium]